METSAVSFWRIFDGTLVNALTVCVGGILGVTMSSRIPERYRTIVLQGLGLVTITLGTDDLHFVLEREGELVGSVLLPDDVPNAWIQLEVRGLPDETPGAKLNSGDATPNSAGTFHVYKLQPGLVEATLRLKGSLESRWWMIVPLE